MRATDGFARRAALAVFCALAPTSAQAHPHVFIEGGVDLRFDASGRLDTLRVIWTYDALTSLFMLEDLGISAEAADTLSAADAARLAAYQTSWEPGYEGDSYLWNGASRVALSGPIDAEARIIEDQVEITFLRILDTPYRPAPGLDGPETTEVRIYDPVYYTRYTVTRTPLLTGNSHGCAARVVPFAPTGPLAALRDSLSDIPVDGDPEGEPGALLADHVRIACD